MFCKKCGAEVPDGASFCAKCGADLTQTTVTGNENRDFGSQTYSENTGNIGNTGNGAAGKANKPKGAVLLLVVGILCLIGGIITLASAATWFNQMSTLESYVSWLGINLSSLWGYGVIVLIDGILLLVIGILSILWRAKREKANMVLVLAIIVIIIRIVDWVYGSAVLNSLAEWIGYSESIVTPASVILGFIMPILLIIGSFLNRKS